MTRNPALATALISAVVPFVMGEQIVTWDNFPVTGAFPKGYDAGKRLTSERDTQVGAGFAAATWTIDDFHLDAPEPGPGLLLDVTSVEWVGIREIQQRPGFGYDLVDWAIFEREATGGGYQFTPLASAMGVPWTLEEELGTLPTNSSMHVFRGSIDITGALLEPGLDYWLGVRLVGNEANWTDPGSGTAGRHFVASASGNPGSIDEGFVWDPAFIEPAQWLRSSEVNLFGNAYDFAYRVTAAVVPEPGSLWLLIAAGLFVTNGRMRRLGRR